MRKNHLVYFSIIIISTIFLCNICPAEDRLSFPELDAAYDDYSPELVQSSNRVSSRSGNCKIIYLMYSRSEDV
ncbi:MAG: hypothetical protein ACOX2I_05935 [Candidatus Ozemobacteraceae bacterium]